MLRISLFFESTMDIPAIRIAHEQLRFAFEEDAIEDLQVGSEILRGLNDLLF